MRERRLWHGLIVGCEKEWETAGRRTVKTLPTQFIKKRTGESPVDSLRLPCVRFSRGATAEPATPSSPVLVVGFTRSLDAAFAFFDERKKHPRRTYAGNTHPLEDVKLESEPDGHRPKDLRKSAPSEQLFFIKS